MAAVSAPRLPAVIPNGSQHLATHAKAPAMDAFDTLNDTLIECVKAAGGSKAVGARLWPEKALEAAQRHLLACLNEGKPERLTPEQVLLVARLAREHGCHAYMEFCARSLSYAAPQPVRPVDEADELRRQVLEMGRAMQAALARLQALDTPADRAAALRAAA